MSTPPVLITAAVMSMLRKELTVRCVADRFGVTEAQVLEWKDIFMIGGVLALTDASGTGSDTCVGSNFKTRSYGEPSADASDPTTGSVTRSIHSTQWTSGGGDPTTHSRIH